MSSAASARAGWGRETRRVDEGLVLKPSKGEATCAQAFFRPNVPAKPLAARMSIHSIEATGGKALVATGEPGLPKLIGLGLLAAAFFSTTFVVNRWMSLAEGPWVWSAALRYVEMALLLAVWIALRRGPRRLVTIWRFAWSRPGYWLLAGGVGFGVFYAGICFGADHVPGWIVAATFQATILAAPLVMLALGARVPLRGVAFVVLIFAGILVLNAHQFALGLTWQQVVLGALPVLVAAIAYPFGNQLVSRARHSFDLDGVLADPAAAVLVMTFGALPVLALLVAVAMPPPPTPGQIAGTFIIALFAGGIATSIFLYARNLSSDPYRIAAVDATQAGEVGFAVIGEIVFLGAPLPDLMGWIGLAAITAGLVGFTLRSAPKPG